MNKVFLLSVVGLLLLSACGATGINKNNAKKSAEYINQELSVADEVKVDQDEYFNEVMDVYRIGEYITVIPNSDSGIEQINFNNVNEDDIANILELFEFPESDSINSLVDEYYYENAATGYSEANDTFVSFEDRGVSVSVKNEILLDVLGDKPFMLTVLYNEERFEEFK